MKLREVPSFENGCNGGVGGGKDTVRFSISL